MGGLSVAVLGAGAMGSLVGGWLAGLGGPVTLLDVNDAHLDAVRRHGLRVTTDAGDQVVHPHALRPEQAEGPFDLVIVLTKQPHTRAALAAISGSLGPATWLLTLQNGLGNLELLEEVAPRERIILGVTTYPAEWNGPGHVSSHGGGETRLYPADGVYRPIVDQIASLFLASGHQAVADPALWVAIWSKVAFNCAMNSVCAVTGCRVGTVAASPDGRQLALDIAAEVVAVAHRSGVAVDGPKVRATLEHAMDTHGGHAPSMLQDMLAGRPTEIASINGAVVTIAARLGQPVPLTAALCTLVRLAEAKASPGP